MPDETEYVRRVFDLFISYPTDSERAAFLEGVQAGFSSVARELHFTAQDISEILAGIETAKKIVKEICDEVKLKAIKEQHASEDSPIPQNYN